MSSKYWYRLDNAAMIFPPVSGKTSPNTFAFSATLDEMIDKDILEKSVREVVKSEDTFRVRLKKGIFWYYLEENDKEPIVQEEPQNFMEYIDYRYDDNYLFRVYYLKNKITVVFFHVLTDGTGGLYFLKQIIYTYLKNRGYDIATEGLIKPTEIPTTLEESTDKFMNIEHKSKEKKIAESKALKLSGTPFKVFGTGIIVGECETSKVKELAKKYNTTITGYLCGLYMFSLYKAYIANKVVKDKTICISIPVNIRKRHPSETKRNFSLVVRVSYDFSKPATLDEVIDECTKQLKEKITTEQLDAQIKFNTGAEKNWLMKIVPRFIKTLVLKIAYKVRGTKQESTNLSNIGVVSLPADISKHVRNMYFILQASKTTQKNLSVLGYDDKLYFAFSRRHIECVAEREFFRTLEENGVDVTVDSNYQEVQRWSIVIFAVLMLIPKKKFVRFVTTG